MSKKKRWAGQALRNKTYLNDYQLWRVRQKYLQKTGRNSYPRGEASMSREKYNEIVYFREVAGWTLGRVGKRVGVSGERVRQITYKNK